MTSVLVLTNSYDDSHVEAVQHLVHKAGHTLFRLDVDRIVRGEHQILWDYTSLQVQLITENDTVDLAGFDSVWFRKPFGYGSTNGFVESIRDPVQRQAVEKEVRDLIDGLCFFLENKFWLNHPRAINKARLKPYQLHLAREIGLPLPETIITNDPAAARSFCLEEPSIFKPITVPHLEYGETFYSVETTLMTDELIESLHLIKSQPAIFQRCINKRYEFRVTCVGNQLFVARQELTNMSSSGTVDWRSLQDTDASRYTISELPSNLEAKVRELMRALDLGFAAMDFAVDHDGKYFFLEANPNGQWLGYTDEIGLPAAAAISSYLVNRATQPNQ